MYSSSELFDTAVDFLFSWSHRLKWIMEVLEQTQILTTELELASKRKKKKLNGARAGK